MTSTPGGGTKSNNAASSVGLSTTSSELDARDLIEPVHHLEVRRHIAAEPEQHRAEVGFGQLRREPYPVNAVDGIGFDDLEAVAHVAVPAQTAAQGSRSRDRASGATVICSSSTSYIHRSLAVGATINCSIGVRYCQRNRFGRSSESLPLALSTSCSFRFQTSCLNSALRALDVLEKRSRASAAGSAEACVRLRRLRRRNARLTRSSRRPQPSDSVPRRSRRENFSESIRLQTPNDASLLHGLDQSRGTVVADLEPPLNSGDRRLTRLRHDAYRLIVKRDPVLRPTSPPLRPAPIPASRSLGSREHSVDEGRRARGAQVL